VPVLPGAARSDEERADTSPSEPTPKRVGDELGTVVRTDVNRNPKSNWLPAPKEPFYMLMRMYLPDIEVLNGQYEIPGVVRGKWFRLLLRPDPIEVSLYGISWRLVV
jgi:hypothetical protein